MATVMEWNGEDITMKAIRVHAYGGPDVLRLEDVPDPQPGAGEVVVHVAAAAVSPLDAAKRDGRMQTHPVHKTTLPYTPGLEAAGTVVALGPDVSGVTIGERVYVVGSRSGAYAERTVCAAAQVRPLLAAMSFVHGAVVSGSYGTAYAALFLKARAQPGETVLVHGATGGVGIAGVQLARAAGLTVIGTGGTEEGRQFLVAQGARHVLAHDAPDFADRITALTGGRGVDIVLEMRADANVGHDLAVLATRGRVVVIGFARPEPVEISPPLLLGRDLSILGLSLANLSAHERTRSDAAIGAGLENGTLRPVVRQELPLADAPRAHEALAQPGAHGRIVLIP